MRDEETFGFNRADTDDLIKLLGGTSQTKPDQILTSRIPSAIFQTPGGGISARSGSVPGAASCTRHYDDSGLTSTGDSETVKNIWTVALPGSYYFIAHSIGGNWYAPQPAIINLRLSGNNLQYTYDGTTWTTWHTATTCP